MWEQLLAAPPDLPLIFLAALCAGMVLYFGLSGASYLFFFVWQRQRYFPGEKRPDAQTIGKAIRLAMCGTLGNAVLVTPIWWAILHGHSTIYFSVSEHGMMYLLLTMVLVLAIVETLLYWIHRTLHRPLFYKWIHVYHHEFRDNNPWVSMAFHPLDSFLQSTPLHLCAFLFPLHIDVYLGFLTLSILWTVAIHDRVTFFPLAALHYTAHHTIHHVFNKYNYGQYLTLWDRCMGTHRDPLLERHPKVTPPVAQTTLLFVSPATLVKEGQK
jgi:Delta7-sterol 5-desaturase